MSRTGPEFRPFMHVGLICAALLGAFQLISSLDAAFMTCERTVLIRMSAPLDGTSAPEDLQGTHSFIQNGSGF